MANQYLDKFRSTVRQSQSSQILKFLNKKKNFGQIKSANEFTQRLQELIGELSANIITPSLKIYRAEESEVISSEKYNFMLDKVQDDLETAFREANQIAEIQSIHESLIRKIILKKIRSALAELSGKINMYEKLANDTYGFDLAIFNTFKEEADNRILRTNENTSLFIDPRLNEEILVNEDADVDIIGERLTLSMDTKSYVPIANIRQVYDNETNDTEFSVRPRSLILENAIDGLNGTYWAESKLFENNLSLVKAKLELDFGNLKTINSIELEPAARFPFYLESLWYQDIDSSFVQIDIDELLLDKNLSLNIDKVFTRKLLLVLRQENSIPVHFEYDANAPESLQEQIQIGPTEDFTPTIKDLSQEFKEIISSQEIQDIIGVENKSNITFDGFEFMFGFDNIKIANNVYGSKGFFLSQPLEVTEIGEVAIKVEETRPYVDNSEFLPRVTDTTYDLNTSLDLTGSLIFPNPDRIIFLGSIEYWCIKQDFLNNLLYKTTYFPILPFGVNRIYHERLMLTERSNSTISYNNIGSTLFYTDYDLGDVKLYKNGVEIVYDSDWFMEDQISLPNSGNKMSFKIRLASVFPTDIYTVSYAPLVSTSNSIPSSLADYTSAAGLQIVDMVGDLSVRHNENNIVSITNPQDGMVSKIYLSVIIRQNTANLSVTPAVEEYTLLAGSEDITKFEGF